MRPRVAAIFLSILLCLANQSPAYPQGGDRDQFVTTLRKAATALFAKDYQSASAFFLLPAGVSPRVLLDLGAQRAISVPGVEALAARGKYGTLESTFGDKGLRWANKFNVPYRRCWAMGLDLAEAAEYWDGSKFVIIRVNHIGDLK